MMVFVDGENIVARFQAMLAEGRKPTSHVAHRVDTYAWSEYAVWPGLNVVQRCTYYTYTTGDQSSIDHVSAELRALRFRQYSLIGQNFTSYLHSNLYPKVFWKQKKRSGKGVDIQMTVDVLTNVYQNNLDVVFLVTGDGDFAPLIQEAQRMGKQVVVAALSSGLSEHLKITTDVFHDLDDIFFESPSEQNAA